MRLSGFALSLFLIFPSAHAQSYLDAYRVDPNGTTYQIFRAKSDRDHLVAKINGIKSRIPWGDIKSIVVERARASKSAHDKVTIELKDGRIFEHAYTDSTSVFSYFLTVDPVTGKRGEQYAGNPPAGSVIEMGSTSQGFRKDREGHIWPAHYFYSPVTGEPLGNTPDNPVK